MEYERIASWSVMYVQWRKFGKGGYVQAVHDVSDWNATCDQGNKMGYLVAKVKLFSELFITKEKYCSISCEI